MQTKKEPGRVVPAPTPGVPGHQARRRVISWVSTVAALAVIALIATALLVSHSGGTVKTGSPGSNTVTPSSSQGWVVVAGLDHLSAQPILAPSNPRVIYLLDARPIALRRSDDEGAHWKNLTLPAQTSQADVALLMINAGDAQNVFLLLTFQQSASACSGNQAPTGAINAFSGYSCQLSYDSTDGGSHWGLMRWSAQAGRSGAVGSVGEIIAQGNHLYSLIYDQNQQESLVERLIMSADGGATWQFADETLRAQGQGLCSFTAAPTGSSLFALVQSGSCTQSIGYLRSNTVYPQARSVVAVWRSDDGGAHWMRVNGFPYQQPDTQSLTAVGGTGGAQPTLFAAAGVGSTYQRLVSADGGKTWEQLPTRGLPSGTDVSYYTQAVLSDGSVLMPVQVAGNSIAFFAWKPGDHPWRQVTAPYVGDPIDVVVVPSAGGHDTLWLVMDGASAGSPPSFSVLNYTIQ